MKIYEIIMSEMLCEEGWEQSHGLDFRALEGTNCYCSEDSVLSLRSALEEIPTDAIHIIDTGDYHYLTYFFLERLTEDFRLILFDNHSDDQTPIFETEGMLSCGGWVKTSRQLPHWSTDPDAPIYISIDLDILKEEHFHTDWNQGEHSPERLFKEIEEASRGHRILGIDICGGITREKGATDRQLEENRKFRTELIKFLENILK